MKTDLSQGAILLEGVISRKCHQHSSPDDLVEGMESPQPFSVKERRDFLCVCGRHQERHLLSSTGLLVYVFMSLCLNAPSLYLSVKSAFCVPAKRVLVGDCKCTQHPSFQENCYHLIFSPVLLLKVVGILMAYFGVLSKCFQIAYVDCLNM